MVVPQQEQPNPMAGTVDVKGKGAKVDDRLTEYLRTGQWTGSGSGDAYSRLRKRIDEMRAGGYAYDPAAATAQQAGPLAAPTGQQSMLDKFRSMPGYAFGMQEGTNSLQSSAANRGGLFSGDTGKDLMSWGQDYAGTKFNEETNRLLAMAGLGQTAAVQSQAAGQAAANNIGAANTQYGGRGGQGGPPRPPPPRLMRPADGGRSVAGQSGAPRRIRRRVLGAGS